MNITHAVDEKVVGEAMEAIFARQNELMEKYHKIEKRSGLLQTESVPVNLDDKKGQARIKDFAWRVTEELGEALDSKDDVLHFKEELIDGLHFLTELSILAGESPNTLTKESIDVFGYEMTNQELSNLDHLEVIADISKFAYGNLAFDSVVVKFIENLGMMCNCLKNKPWKQSNMITDKKAFKKQLAKVWVSYIAILTNVLSTEEIVNIYLKKSQVNKFRQRSNY